MPSIHDTPPDAIQNDLNNLAQALYTHIPAKSDTNLLIATWNILPIWHFIKKPYVIPYQAWLVAEEPGKTTYGGNYIGMLCCRNTIKEFYKEPI